MAPNDGLEHCFQAATPGVMALPGKEANCSTAHQRKATDPAASEVMDARAAPWEGSSHAAPAAAVGVGAKGVWCRLFMVGGWVLGTLLLLKL